MNLWQGGIYGAGCHDRVLPLQTYFEWMSTRTNNQSTFVLRYDIVHAVLDNSSTCSDIRTGNPQAPLSLTMTMQTQQLQPFRWETHMSSG